MLKLQITLIAILIACVAFVSCDRAQDMLAPVTEDMTATDDTTTDADMMTDMMEMMDSSMYMSWASVVLDAPTMTVAEAAAAMNPGGTGAAHGMGSRTVYFNDAGAMANMAGTAYPAGTMIIKKVMDPTETFVMQVVTMMKTDDPMYTAYNGWGYGATQRASETEELMMPQTVPMEVAAQCHGCHAKATNDSVFVSLPMDKTPETPEMPETPETPEMPETPETPETPEMPETDAGNGNGNGANDGAGNGNGNGANDGAGNGNGNGDGGTQ